MVFIVHVRPLRCASEHLWLENCVLCAVTERESPKLDTYSKTVWLACNVLCQSSMKGISVKGSLRRSSLTKPHTINSPLLWNQGTVKDFRSSVPWIWISQIEFKINKLKGPEIRSQNIQRKWELFRELKVKETLSHIKIIQQEKRHLFFSSTPFLRSHLYSVTFPRHFAGLFLVAQSFVSKPPIDSVP